MYTEHQIEKCRQDAIDLYREFHPENAGFSDEDIEDAIAEEETERIYR
jgi:hypothetical protein